MGQAATKEDIRALGNNLREGIKENTREIISHFNASQGEQNKRLDRIETKVDTMAEDVAKVKLAVVDLIATDRHLHNLVRELKAQGVKLDEAKIFASS
ncbi:MAG: hypothetical protein HY420_00620 [Candidatus Kerfeldbacteria bacterium]|nr:hypothetical protein [Candidatus Kerfeldbacteria bacterium]